MLRSVATGDWIADRGWVRPELGGACFASLPGAITELLTGDAIGPTLPTALTDGLEDRYDRVVLVYFDAFGCELAARVADHPLLAGAAVHARLTSQFPSTTTVHMTTIQTGQPVGEHGLYEWFILEPRLDRLIAPLPFCFAGDGQPQLTGRLEPGELYPDRSVYEWLGARDVASVVCGGYGYGTSATSTALLRGASAQVGYHDVGEGLAELAAVFAALPAPAYGFVYIDTIDSLMHKVGPGAHALIDAEVTSLLDAIERRLLRALPEGTLVLLTSDHGMAPVSPGETTYLNAGPRGVEVRSHLRSGAEPGGHPLAPAGSCRDLFLHAEPGHVEDLVDVLRRVVGERAEVRRRDELVDAGLFGPSPTERLLERLGDVAVLPQFGDAVYWYTPGRFRQALWGQHGGLTPQEMEIPLVAVVA
ncbi:MAG: alkaline phosphatase family protein [Solirubrobacteraceae bacterium]